MGVYCDDLVVDFGGLVIFGWVGCFSCELVTLDASVRFICCCLLLG